MPGAARHARSPPPDAVRSVSTCADTIVSAAKSVYQTVEGLVQVRAGRQRTIVEETSQVRAQRVLIGADEDVKVQGDKIHLG